MRNEKFREFVLLLDGVSSGVLLNPPGYTLDALDKGDSIFMVILAFKD